MDPGPFAVVIKAHLFKIQRHRKGFVLIGLFIIVGLFGLYLKFSETLSPILEKELTHKSISNNQKMVEIASINGRHINRLNKKCVELSYQYYI